jgi:hypothetical protein
MNHLQHYHQLRGGSKPTSPSNSADGTQIYPEATLEVQRGDLLPDNPGGHSPRADQSAVGRRQRKQCQVNRQVTSHIHTHRPAKMHPQRPLARPRGGVMTRCLDLITFKQTSISDCSKAYAKSLLFNCLKASVRLSLFSRLRFETLIVSR